MLPGLVLVTGLVHTANKHLYKLYQIVSNQLTSATKEVVSMLWASLLYCQPELPARKTTK